MKVEEEKEDDEDDLWFIYSFIIIIFYTRFQQIFSVVLKIFLTYYYLKSYFLKSNRTMILIYLVLVVLKYS